MASWWEKTLNPKGLSQGDVLSDTPFAVSPIPPVFLKKATAKKGVEVWQVTDQPPPKDFLYSGAQFPALVVSHSCELDKKERKGRILLAPLRPIDNLPEESRDDVLAQRRISLMPLPNVPGIGSHYADLRLITAADRRIAPDNCRVASMTEEGVKRLQAQLVAYFARKDLSAIISSTSA